MNTSTMQQVQSSKRSSYPYLKGSLTLILYFAVINSVLLNFGPISTSFAKTISLLLLFLLIVIQTQDIQHLLWTRNIPYFKKKKVLLGILVIIGGFFLVLVSSAMIHHLLGISIVILGLFLLNSTRQKNLFFYHLIVTTFLLIVLYVVYVYVSMVWTLLLDFSLEIMQWGLPTPLLLGPSTVGLWMMVLFGCWYVASALMIERSMFQRILWMVIPLLVLLVIWKMYFVALVYFSLLELENIVGIQLGLFVIQVLVVLVVVWRYSLFMRISNWRSFSLRMFNGKQWITIGIGVVLFWSALVLILPFGSSYEQGISVGLYAENMLGSWDHPEYGRYGREAAGMFGLLPAYLKSFGYDPVLLVGNVPGFFDRTYATEVNTTRFVNLTDFASVVEMPLLTADALAQVDVLVIINHNTTISSGEYAVIWEFVSQGGGLLVLGDHTDVGGVLDPLNTVLDPVAIRFRFDSSLPLDSLGKWETCAFLFEHPITRTVDDGRDLQISVGASLDIGWDAFPLILGRYGFSDHGNRDNVDFAFLGNYEYDPGERYGDVVLAAGAFYGDGRVVVFGDTSSFQNSALARSYVLVDGMVQWLADRDETVFQLWLYVGSIVILSVLGLFLMWRRLRIPFSVVGIPMMVLMLLVSSGMGGSLITESSFESRHVLIDVAHTERFSIGPFLDDSLTGMELSFQRNGFLPIYLKERIGYSQIAASFMVFNAPAASFTENEVAELITYMRDGGVVVIASGYLEKEAVRPLLSRFDIDIVGVPLGPVPYVEEDPSAFEFEPRFVNSWPIQFASGEIRSFYNFSWNEQVYHLVVFQPVGGGGLLLVSDSEFFMDKNVESIYDYWPGNIIFLKHIIDELSKGGVL